MMLRAAVLLLAALACGLAPAGPAQADPTRNGTTAFPGRIEALNRADVSNAVASIVTAIHFNPGQTVERGQVLFTLDATEFELALQTQEANVMRAEATLRQAQQDYKRLLTLQQRGSATGVQLLKAEVAQSFADAVRAETRADLKAAQIALDRTVIRAPISGVISAPEVSVGTYVKIGRGPLASIVQLDPVRLSYQVPYVQRVEELDIEDLRFPESLLARVELTIQVSDDWYHPLTARPSNVAAKVDYSTGNLTVWAVLPNPAGQLRPGMRVTVLSRVLDAGSSSGN